MNEWEGLRPHIQALLAAMRHDWDEVRAELDLLDSETLNVLRCASGDLDVEIGYTLAQRGHE